MHVRSGADAILRMEMRNKRFGLYQAACLCSLLITFLQTPRIDCRQRCRASEAVAPRHVSMTIWNFVRLLHGGPSILMFC